MKNSPKMATSSLEDLPKVLIIGDKDSLTTKLLKTLEKKGCQVFFRQKLKIPAIKFDYIFQFKFFDETEKIIEKALKDKTRYLVVEIEESFNDQERKIVESIVFNFKDKLDCRILRLRKIDLLKLNTSVDQIMKTMFGRRKPLPLLTQPPVKREKKKAKKKSQAFFLPKSRHLLSCYLVILLSCCFPYLFFGFNFCLGLKSLFDFKKVFLTADFVNAENKAMAAENYFHQAEKLAGWLPFLKTGKDWSFFGKSLAETSETAVKLTVLSQKIGQIILGKEEGRFDQRLDQLKIETENLEREIGLTTALYQDLGLEKYQKIQPVGKALSEAKELCLLVKKVLPLINEMTEDKVYLILFQNNMELRPGGGFIGSYGLAHFQNHQLIKLETNDIYAADGQLKGHVEPPAPIRKYLDQPHFFLRDSNWSADFATNAQKAIWFYQKEIGDQVDGVIGLDLSLVEKILKALGKVYLTDYQLEVTADNLFLKAQNLIQSDFFPGSTQKRDFLGALARAVLNQAKLGEFPWLKIGQSLKQGLEEKHLQIFLNDQKGQSLVEELGWAGRVSVVSCQLSVVSCLADYLMILEANLGVNKANYFVKREIGLTADFKEKKVNYHLIINYQNNSSGQTFPGGVYKNYLRIYVPQTAILEKVVINEREVLIDQIEIEEIEDKKSWGFLVEIKPEETKKVEFEYQLERQELVARKEFTYELFFQKQAGTEKDPLFLKFNYPQNWRIKKTNFPAVTKNSSFNYNTDLSVDRIFSIEFLKE